ncbi:hypothetical protein [Acidithiobacillus thiooxidans]|jgi:protein subunit release factor A|nr:hypothetical protein [Acidithiobacillus thiooxidans]
MQIEITLQAGEGGQDARLLTADQAALYKAYAVLNGLRIAKETGTGS